MTNQKQKKLIAKTCGWIKCNECEPSGCNYWWKPGDDLKLKASRILPDYLNDLNAMHEAEKYLDNPANTELYNHYEKLLCDLTQGHPAFAKASQRAEAFLKTINLWQD